VLSGFTGAYSSDRYPTISQCLLPCWPKAQRDCAPGEADWWYTVR
jgi:hypothetical protein